MLLKYYTLFSPWEAEESFNSSHFEVVPASKAYACFDPTSKTNLPENRFSKAHVAKYSTETKIFSVY